MPVAAPLGPQVSAQAHQMDTARAAAVESLQRVKRPMPAGVIARVMVALAQRRHCSHPRWPQCSVLVRHLVQACTSLVVVVAAWTSAAPQALAAAAAVHREARDLNLSSAECLQPEAAAVEVDIRPHRM